MGAKLTLTACRAKKVHFLDTHIKKERKKNVPNTLLDGKITEKLRYINVPDYK